jgi:hypothetical protein
MTHVRIQSQRTSKLNSQYRLSQYRLDVKHSSINSSSRDCWMRRGAADGSTRARPICGWLISTPPPVFRPLTPLVCLTLHRVKPDSHYKRLATQFVALKSSLSGRLIRTSRCEIVASRQGRQAVCTLLLVTMAPGVQSLPLLLQQSRQGSAWRR